MADEGGDPNEMRGEEVRHIPMSLSANLSRITHDKRSDDVSGDGDGQTREDC